MTPAIARRYASFALAAALTVWLAACGGGDGARTQTVVASPTQAASATPPAAPTLTPAAAAPTTAATPGALVPQTVSGYASISAPAGWTIEDLAAPGGFIRRYVLTVGGARKAQLQLQCRPRATIDDMTKTTMQTVQGLNGTWQIGGTKPVTLAGLSGIETDYDIPSVNNEEVRIVYLAGAKCGWSIALQSFGQGSRAQYASLFEQILATFQPAFAGG